MIDNMTLGLVAFLVSLLYTAGVGVAICVCCGREINRLNKRVDSLENKENEGE